MYSKLILPGSASLVVMLFSVAAMAQQPALNFPIAESLDVGSPEVVNGERDPGGISMVASTSDFDGAKLVRASDLGLPVDFAHVDIDAFTTGTDVFPHEGIVDLNNPAIQGREIVVEFTPHRNSVGVPGSVINAEWSSDGCASDTYVAEFFPGEVPGYLPVYLGSDHLDLTGQAGSIHPAPISTAGVSSPSVGESNINAMDWATRPIYPVWFSVTPATAAWLNANGYSPTGAAAYHAADIYTVTGPGSPPAVDVDHATLGLSGSDITALARDKDDYFVFSVDNTTSSLACTCPSSMGSAILWVWHDGAGASPEPWALDSQLDLDLNALNGGDGLDGVRIGDPVNESYAQGSLPANPSTQGPTSGSGFRPGYSSNYALLKIDGSDGGRLRRVVTDPFNAIRFSFDALDSHYADQAFVWMREGVAQNDEATTWSISTYGIIQSTYDPGFSLVPGTPPFAVPLAFSTAPMMNAYVTPAASWSVSFAVPLAMFGSVTDWELQGVGYTTGGSFGARFYGTNRIHLRIDPNLDVLTGSPNQ